MASITYWNRLEPRPVAPSMAESLAARVRDPLWFLTRQWQFGEFQGEDAGSPAFARVTATTMPLTAWKAGSGPTQPLPPGMPFEALVEREAHSPNLALRVELSQLFERLLTAAGMSPALIRQVVDELRLKLPLAEPEADDIDARRFYLMAGRRAFDGILLYDSSRTSPPTVPPSVNLPAGTAAAFSAAQVELARWVAHALGEIGTSDPPAWQPNRLEYAAGLETSGTVRELAARSSIDGAFEWHAFDLAAPDGPEPGRDGEAAEQQVQWSVIPTPVRFRGMPNARWWDFEHGATDFGDIRPDQRDLARLIVMDFMLVHGNDWFVIPYEVPVGSLCRVDSLVVRDVFGGDTVVERADKNPIPAGMRWSLFSTTADQSPNGFTDFMVLPPTAASFMSVGPVLEEVRFVRDQIANMVWAIEETVEGGAGAARPGHERNLPVAPAVTPPGTMPRYRIQTDVPRHWIPFLPVTTDAVSGAVVLERGAIPDPASSMGEPIRPTGRILQPSALVGQRYQVFEEEVPRVGVRITRVVCRSRWTDGSTHLWTARRKVAGQGEALSGLAFDKLEE